MHASTPPLTTDTTAAATTDPALDRGEYALQERRSDVLLPEDEADPDEFPRLHNISAAHFYKAIVRPAVPEPPIYVTLTELVHPCLAGPGAAVAVAEWNMLWEAAQYRRRFFDLGELPAQMARIADLGDVNVVFVPRTRSRYHEYAPLLHLLPRRVLLRFGLPLLRGGQWPFMADFAEIDAFLPADLADRLGRAWAWAVWPHLVSGSRLSAFSSDDPVRLLAHNLDFWIPAVTAMMQARLREHDEIDKGPLPTVVPLEDGGVLDGAVPGHPRMGGQIWFGEDDARDAVVETVEAADQTGRLRGILDAVRSHRVADDFSPQWSYAREDFERKLHRKRNKVSVRFVELTDTIPLQGPESKIVGSLVTNDFLATLDTRNRQIVVLLNSGMTSRTEIAERLGYADHSAVSKRLAQIRIAAERYFDRC
jgi:hypothetical protein